MRRGVLQLHLPYRVQVPEGQQEEVLLEKQFRPDMLYNRVVHYYMDKRGYPKEKANEIARRVVQREATRRICKNSKCKHFLHDHVRNSETCLVADCRCGKFTK